MSVIVIGNRFVGKTSMVVTLAKETLAQGMENVKIVTPDPQTIIQEYSNSETGEIAPTDRKSIEAMQLNIRLRSRPQGRSVSVTWIDTPGEAWQLKEEWNGWSEIIKALHECKAVFLLLPPYRSHSKKADDQDLTILDKDTWRSQLQNWLEFLRKHAAAPDSKIQHLVIAAHKADLFCHNLDDEEEKWRFNPEKRYAWTDHNTHIRNTYFSFVDDIIREHNSSPPHITPQLFITTLKRPSLLELPWVYLGTYLAYV